MILITCSNCNQVLMKPTKQTASDDVISLHFQCKCEAVYRVDINLLHTGKPQDYAQREAELAYTYDEVGNRVTLQAHRDATAKQEVQRG